jgi:hypothetical protein
MQATTSVRCQQRVASATSAIEEECLVVAYEYYESCGIAASSAAANPIKLEPSDERGPRGSDPRTEDCTLPEETDDLDAPSTSGSKRARCETVNVAEVQPSCKAAQSVALPLAKQHNLLQRNTPRWL